MKSKKLLLIPLLGLLLAGCRPQVSESSSVPEEVFSDYYKLEKGVNYDNRALDQAGGLTALHSVGDQKLLVVPIVFTDGSSHSRATPENHEMLETVFFGTSEETGWESVSSYYNKSSLGRLTLTGEVFPYFYSSYNVSQFVDLEISNSQEFGNPDNYWDQTHYLLREVYEAFDAATLKAYDLDNDGHVDGLWLVYMVDHVTTGDSPFWAYKFYWNQEPNMTKPTPNTYAWASYDFALEGKEFSRTKPDAHTYIHETGHMFGLNDYYDYENESAPTGKVDMMDNNIIDHNVYSKFFLNWTEPYVVTGNADISLRPAESSGDFILLKDGWNGHAYDNYILIEYYTPTGLNKSDSDTEYITAGQTSGIKGFTESGIRIWHVDSRLIRYRGYNDYTWVDKIQPETETSVTIMGPNNSADSSSRRRIKESFKQLHLMDAKGVTSKVGNWLRTPTTAGNNALFKTGHIVAADDWGKYLQTALVNGVRPATFNDGSPVGYSVEIGEMTAEGVVIKVRKA